jgi:hypothetical protein
MFGFIFVNGDVIASINCAWDEDKLEYKIRTESQFKNPKSFTFNSAAEYIIDILATYPKGTSLGIGWPIYGSMLPMHKIKYRSVFDLRHTAVTALIGTRDFYTDKEMERTERGDEALDGINMLQPLGLFSS